MKQVASTDRGRLIALAGKAIELTNEEKRDAEQLNALLDHLQAYKEGKPYPPPSTPAPSCCGYPHYNRNRPDPKPNQIRHLCQLYPGLRIRSNNPKYGVIGEYEVVSYPYRRGGPYMPDGVSRDHDWWIKVKYFEGVAMGVESEHSLADAGIVGGVSGTFYGPGWNINWLSFINPPIHCHHHRPHSCCHH